MGDTPLTAEEIRAALQMLEEGRMDERTVFRELLIAKVLRIFDAVLAGVPVQQAAACEGLMPSEFAWIVRTLVRRKDNDGLEYSKR